MRLLPLTGLGLLAALSAPALADEPSTASSTAESSTAESSTAESSTADSSTAETPAPSDALAQDEDEEEEEDEDDDLFGGETPTVRDEVEAVRNDEMGNNVGARREAALDLAVERARRERVIQTIQQKNFLKLRRWELSPHVAFVSNDPFLNRYIIGAGLAYNITEVFALEASLDFSPDLGTADWKPLTTQLVEENHVSPDISRLTLFGSANFIFSPIYGKAALMGNKIINFDIYGKFGMGATQTEDDAEALQADEANVYFNATHVQVHPTTNFGGGARIIFNQNVAARVEGYSMVYIETVNSGTLEMKNNFIVQGSASFFFPSMD